MIELTNHATREKHSVEREDPFKRQVREALWVVAATVSLVAALLVFAWYPTAGWGQVSVRVTFALTALVLAPLALRWKRSPPNLDRAHLAMGAAWRLPPSLVHERRFASTSARRTDHWKRRPPKLDRGSCRRTPWSWSLTTSKWCGALLRVSWLPWALRSWRRPTARLLSSSSSRSPRLVRCCST